MTFLLIPLNNLRRRPLRTWFTVTGISAAIGLFVVVMGMSNGVERAYVGALEERGTHVIAVRKGVIDILSGSIDEKQENALKSFPGIVAVSPELIDWVILNSGHTVVVVGWPMESFLWESLVVQEGSSPPDSNTNGVIVGQRIAQALGLDVGGELTLHGDKSRVTGISRPGGVIRSSAVVLPLDRLQRLTDRPGKVTAFNLRIADPKNKMDVATTIDRLNAAFPDLSFMQTGMVAKKNHMMQILRSFSWATSLVAVFIGALIMLNTLLMSVSERTREIGILSALGWKPTRILSMIFSEGLLLVLAALVGGILLGILGLYFFAHSPRTGGFVEARITMLTLLQVVGAGLLIGGFGCFYPAWRAIQLHPGEALRHE
jgi:putative ABC transport system permease protein